MSGDPCIIGHPRRRVDGRAKVTGQTRFADDIMLPRMLHCRLLRSPSRTRASSASTSSRADTLDGVHLVLTGDAFPVPYGILPVSHDEHALCRDMVRFVGDPVAAVIARDEVTAEAAVNLIDVEYEPLRTYASPSDSLTYPEPRIHDYGDRGNIHKIVNLQFGDVDEAIARADYVFDDVFFFEGNTHLPLEQHAAVALKDPDGKLVIHSSTQTPHYLHRALAKVLGDARGAHPRHRDAERRRLRRQERSLQPRDRRRQGCADARSSGEDLPQSRRSLLLPSRQASGADAVRAPG